MDTWDNYSFIDETKPYTRNLIATDHQTYSLLLLCWNPGQESPIHNHPCDGCWLQVLEGMIREVRYDTNLQETSNEVYSSRDNVTYITDQDGFHKVGHACPTEPPAMTLHVYAPPFTKCKVWATRDAKGGIDPNGAVASSQNYSEFGRILEE